MLRESVIPGTRSHLQRGWQLAWGAPHMAAHDASTGDSRRNVPAVPQKTGTSCGTRGRRGQLQTGATRPLNGTLTKTWRQMGSAGISFIVKRERVGLRERESEYCTTLAKQVTAWAEREEVELGETKTTPACQKRAEKTRSCLGRTSLNKTSGGKKGGLKQPFSEMQTEVTSVFAAWVVSSVGFGIWILVSPFCNILSASKQTRTRRPHIKRACWLSSVMRHQAFHPAFYRGLLRVFRWLQRANVHAVITPAWFTSSNMQVCCFDSNPSKSITQWFTQSIQNNRPVEIM